MSNVEKNTLTLIDRTRLSLNGVENVGSFDDAFVKIVTALGELFVEGEELKIKDLSHERGEILIEGKISAVYYKDKLQKKRKSKE